MENIYDVLILGGGPGGYTAALYAARAGLRVLVFERLAAGGQMALTHQIDNYPGYDEGIDGFTLGQKMQQGAQRFGAQTVYTDIDRVELNGEIKKFYAGEEIYRGRTAVIAAGADPRKLQIPMEKEMTGKGVHYCAACDGMFYQGKTVVLAGGGNSAAADAMALSRVAKKVILVHRRDTLRASKVYHRALQQIPNLQFRWNCEVTQLQYSERVTGVILRDRLTGKTEAIACDGVFVSIGREPATAMFRGQTDLDDKGYIIADESTQTNIPGVYAVGDIRTKKVRQIVTATADGAAAAWEIEEYLAQVIA